MKYIETEKLKPHKDNPRKISMNQLDRLCESILSNPEYFEARPIICDAKMVIWAGNSRYKAAKKLGLAKVPVQIIDLPEEKMKEIMIRDNVNNGEWDTNILADEWDINALVDFGLEFKGAWGEEQIMGESEPEPKSKKTKAKKVVTCPHCGKEIEV